MAKTTFSPLLLGLFLVLIMLLSSQQCVNAESCVDFERSATRQNIYEHCEEECQSLFGDKLLRSDVHDVTWLGRYHCTCCYTDETSYHI
ncbi:hypothetical protein MKX03_010317 [Papaver bracteatum]|nr:hypothetical protein MKX03_010317 [Papaver bracteatum]